MQYDIEQTLSSIKACTDLKQMSPRTANAYCLWTKRYIAFHNMQNPLQMGGDEIKAYLSYVSDVMHVSQATQYQVVAALLFLYKDVLGVQDTWLYQLDRPLQPKAAPVTVTEDEVEMIFSHLSSLHLLMAQMLYETGMRLDELLKLRIRNIDMTHSRIEIESGDPMKHRVAPVPCVVKSKLKAQITMAFAIYEQDRAKDKPGVSLPPLVQQENPDCAKDWQWFWLLPAEVAVEDPHTLTMSLQPINQQSFQRAFKRAVEKTGITKAVTVHSLRHSFAVQRLRLGDTLARVQQLMGHADPKTTRIYQHISKTANQDA